MVPVGRSYEHRSRWINKKVKFFLYIFFIFKKRLSKSNQTHVYCMPFYLTGSLLLISLLSNLARAFLLVDLCLLHSGTLFLLVTYLCVHLLSYWVYLTNRISGKAKLDTTRKMYKKRSYYNCKRHLLLNFLKMI